MRENEWQLSLKVESDPRIQYALKLARNARSGDDRTVAALFDRSYSGWTEHLDDEDAHQERIGAYFSGEFFKSLSRQQRILATRALNLDDSAKWEYGVAQEDNGLWEFDVSARTNPVTEIDRLVLSGVVGAELMGINKRADKYMTALEPDLLERSVLMGSLALLSHRSAKDMMSAFYRGSEQGGIVPQTHIGGSIHGDFWTSRQDHFLELPIDPFGHERFAAPALEEVSVPAYHSTETRILEALLEYRVLYDIVSPAGLYREIENALRGVGHKPGGAFGDFGQDDGFSEANSLYKKVENAEPVGDGTIIARLGVYPGDRNTSLVMTACKGGVEFSTVRYGETVNSFIVPSAEITDYIVTLFSAGQGRTSQAALAAVVAGLIEKPAYNDRRQSR